jgi:hypothetical protein
MITEEDEERFRRLRSELSEARENLFRLNHQQALVLVTRDRKLLRRSDEIIFSTAAARAKVKRLEVEYDSMIDELFGRSTTPEERNRYRRVVAGRPNLALLVV